MGLVRTYSQSALLKRKSLPPTSTLLLACSLLLWSLLNDVIRVLRYKHNLPDVSPFQQGLLCVDDTIEGKGEGDKRAYLAALDVPVKEERRRGRRKEKQTCGLVVRCLCEMECI